MCYVPVADGLQAYKISQQAASVDPAPVSSVSTTPLPPTGETTNTGQQGEKAADKVQETPSTETASETAFQQPVKGPPGGMPLDSTPSLSVDEPIDLSSVQIFVLDEAMISVLRAKKLIMCAGWTM